MKTGDASRAGWRRLGRPRYAGTLTPRQQDVFDLLARGLTNEEIAQHLGITPYGVKYHVAEILQRLGVENRHDAVALRVRREGNGWLAAWAPVMFLRKLPFAWLPKAAAGAVLATAAAGIALLAWGVMATGLPPSGIGEISVGARQTAGRVDSAQPEITGVTAISATGHQTCALKDGGVSCWGEGIGPVPVAVSGLGSGVSAISGSTYHTCALKNGGAWCWGDNFFGELGNGTTTNSSVPVAASGLGSGVSAISLGSAHSCALRDGGVWCLGYNGSGELGNNSTVNSLVPVPVSGLGSGVSAISRGGGQTCALKGGGAWCWGGNNYGQLGNNSTTDSPVPVPVSGLGSGVSAISAGSLHTCAVKDGGVWCWGFNGRDQLGNNSGKDSRPIEYAPIYGGPISSVPVPVLFTPPSAGDIADGPDSKALPSQTSSDSADHRASYVLGGTAAAALAIVATGMWAMRRRRRIV